jgi:hypothetical protein
MRRGTQRATLILTAVAALVYPAATAAVAAPASPPARLAAASELPSYDGWIADVTAVTDVASRYLATRLPDPAHRTAIVLDIDNTSLVTHYTTGIVFPATPSVLALALQAEQAGAAVFFVTARTELIDPLTKYNLEHVGYPIDGLYVRGVFDFESDENLKIGARTAIEQLGYTIVANIGNNPSDLAGGHAERTFKLPDYDGQLA